MAIYLKLVGHNYDDANPKHKYMKVELRYQLGGINYATYDMEKRGYYAHAQIVEREKHDYNGRPYWTESYTAFSNGGKILLKEVTRKSKKATEELSKDFLKNETVKYLIGRIEEESREKAIY